MDKLARLLAIGVAAFFSAATSAPQTTYWIDQTSVLPGETDVAARPNLSLRVSERQYLHVDTKATVFLERADDGALIDGVFEIRKLSDGAELFHFTPAADLPADTELRLVFEEHKEAEFFAPDPFGADWLAEDGYYYDYAVDSRTRYAVPFSTASGARVRAARLFDDGSIRLSFSQDLDPSVIVNATLLVDGEPAQADIRYVGGAHHELLVTPAQTVAPDAALEIELANGIEQADGASMPNLPQVVVITRWDE